MTWIFHLCKQLLFLTLWANTPCGYFWHYKPWKNKFIIISFLFGWFSYLDKWVHSYLLKPQFCNGLGAGAQVLATEDCRGGLCKEGLRLPHARDSGFHCRTWLSTSASGGHLRENIGKRGSRCWSRDSLQACGEDLVPEQVDISWRICGFWKDSWRGGSGR